MTISIITGGAGGMGLATAKLVGKEHHVVIVDVNQQRLDSALEALKALGISCDSAVCDITRRGEVDSLFQTVAKEGKIVSVIHTAGVSPQMTDAKTIMKVNALGTVNITEAAYAIASDGFALVNVASMAAYIMPAIMIPRRAFRYAGSNADVFLRKSLFLSHLMPGKLYRNGLSYAVSKAFVIWYSKKNAARFGRKNARIVSVSPGSFDTDMGRLEEKSGSAKMLEKAALKRFGRAEEIAEVLAFCAGSKAGYLTGVDLLCDGGVVASST